MNHMNYRLMGLVVAALMLSGCFYRNDGSKRNLEYSPNMAHSIALDPYSQVTDPPAPQWWSQPMHQQTVFKNGLNAQYAPAGTVPRTADSWYVSEEFETYHIPNTPEGYELAGSSLAMPFENAGYKFSNVDIGCSEEIFSRGKRLYETYCVMCHGANGNGVGTLSTKGNKPFEGAVPSYTSSQGTGLRNLPAGKMYHSIHYGKNAMGSYASQMTPKERWEVVCYIQHFQKLPE